MGCAPGFQPVETSSNLVLRSTSINKMYNIFLKMGG